MHNFAIQDYFFCDGMLYNAKKRRIISKENSAQAKGKLSYLLSRKSIFSPSVLFNMLDTETNNYTKKLLCMSVLNIIILAPTFSAY